MGVVLGMSGCVTLSPVPTEQSGVYPDAIQVNIGQPVAASDINERALVSYMVAQALGVSLSQVISDVYRVTVAIDEYLAFYFTTTVPGRVHLFSVDATGSYYQNSYDAVPFADNRFPRTRAFYVDPQTRPGSTSWLDLEFTPCIPRNLAHDGRLASFASTLNYCQTVQAGMQVEANVSAKRMVNPESGEFTAIPVTPTDYRRGDAMRLRIEIEHNSSIR